MPNKLPILKTYIFYSSVQKNPIDKEFVLQIHKYLIKG